MLDVLEVLKPNSVDSIVTGTGIARVNFEEVTVESREHPLNDMNQVDITLENVTTIQRGFNNFESVNIFNFYIDPSATDLQTAGVVYGEVAVIIRFLNVVDAFLQILRPAGGSA